MTKYGISDFKISSKYHFHKQGDVQSVKFHIYHEDDRNGVEIELDYEYDCETALTDLVEWAYKLGKESCGK